MKKRYSALVAALTVLSAVALQAQVTYIEDAPDLINDYVSIGEFNVNDNLEGWARNQGAVAPLKVVNGVLEVVTTAGDPWFYRAGLADTTPEFTTVEVRLKLVSGTGGGFEMFWGTSAAGGGGFAGGRRIGYSLGFADNAFHVIQFEMTEALAGERLTDFRIDPGGDAGNKLHVDYVRVGKISADTDGDGLPDTVETGTGIFVGPRDTGTKPDVADTDGDGANDGFEVTYGTDPNDPAQFPVPSIDSYSQNPAIYVVANPIEPNVPTYSAGTPTSYQVSPNLPAGLSLEAATGIISGTPTAASPMTDYTVTANFPGGKTATKVVQIEVRNPYIEFAVTTWTVKLNASVPSIIPVAYGQAPQSFSISPALPEGLELEPTTGEIYGVPTAYTPSTTFTVTATYAGFPNATTQFTLSVLETPVLTLDPETPVSNYFSLGEFDDEADLTGWYQNNIQQPFAMADGSLKVVTVGGDPYFGKGLTLERDYTFVEFRMKITGGTMGSLNIYWAENAPGRGMSETTRVALTPIPDDGEFHVYQVDFSKAKIGPFNSIRLDTGDGADITFDLDYWRVGDFSPVAPTMAIAVQPNGSLRISWPATAQGFNLQSTGTLPGGWAADTTNVQTEGNERFIVVQPAGGAKFYRLTN